MKEENEAGFMVGLFDTMMEFYSGIAKLTVLLPFTLLHAWKISRNMHQRISAMKHEEVEKERHRFIAKDENKLIEYQKHLTKSLDRKKDFKKVNRFKKMIKWSTDEYFIG